MKDIAITDKDYKQWVSEVRGRYRQSQIKAAVKVNSEMLQFYWSLGHDIVERQMENTYGSGFFKRLSADLQRELPDAKGFSPTNIKYIKYFYELYPPMLENRQQVVDDFALQNSSQPADDFKRQTFPQVGKICSAFLGDTTFKLSTNARAIRKKHCSLFKRQKKIIGAEPYCSTSLIPTCMSVKARL